MKKSIFLLFFLLYSDMFTMDFSQIERRKNQYPNDQGYFIAPVPYALPGIGSGMLVLGMINNIKGSQTDLVIDVISGDVGGYGFGIGDWYLVDKHLKFELLHSKFDKASIQSYSTRGMKSDKDDYINVEVDAMEFTGMRATLSFYDKMIELYAMAYLSSFNLKSLKDKNGNTILDASDSKTEHGKIYIGGLMLDYTDDGLDPRHGIRLDTTLDYSPRDGTEGANYFVSNYNLTGYIPVGRKSTWAFNYYRSGANVIKKGDRLRAADRRAEKKRV